MAVLHIEFDTCGPVFKVAAKLGKREVGRHSIDLAAKDIDRHLDDIVIMIAADIVRSLGAQLRDPQEAYKLIKQKTLQEYAKWASEQPLAFAATATNSR
jgi:hypothetical protein